MFRPATIRTAAALAVALSILVCWGCGYRVAGRGDLPGGVQTLAVQLLENRSSETGVETLVTNALINELNRRRQGTVTRAGKAGATLLGSIDTITWDTVARRGSITAAERRVYATISLRLIDRNAKTIWQRSGMRAEQAYTVAEDDKQETENRRRQAISELSQRIAETVYRRLTDRF